MPREDEPDDDLPPKPPRRRDDDEYEDDDRPRRRRRDDDDDYEARQSDVTGGLIPYKNGKALAAYYCGVFSLILCVAFVLGPLAIIFGFLGLSHAKKHPQARGKGHAIAGIVLGFITSLLTYGGTIAVVVYGALQR